MLVNKHFWLFMVVIAVFTVINFICFLKFYFNKYNKTDLTDNQVFIADKHVRLKLKPDAKILLEVEIDNDKQLNFEIATFRKTENTTERKKIVNAQSDTQTQTTIESSKTSPELTTIANENNLCPLIPPNLNGRISVNTNESTLEEIEEGLKDLGISTGGEWSPSHCKARYKVAIIIPYRNREKNLHIFLRHMHRFLSKQLIEYGIFLVEPQANLTFNRGLLMNIGFLESLNISNDKWDCFMFHDVDLIPEDERNIYSCPETPRHMSSAVSTFNYQLPYSAIFGGVSSLTKQQMKDVNGYSNLYFGWGAEDDDFRARIEKKGYKVSRYPLEIGRYLMANHNRDQVANPKRYELLRDAVERMPREGLNSIEYKLIKVNKAKLFTQILVFYDENHIMLKKYK